jgi:hypothetical protein
MKQIHLSETKLNLLATEISNRLFDSHYFNQDVISGEDLNNFCDHEQINKFLLFQVYQVWQLQISRFKHPYFNFNQPEVNQLLNQLQNLLSRNIAIKKEDFRPLLYKAVLNNLRLLSDPKAALQQFFFQNQDKISVGMYEKYTPFFSDFDFVIKSILKYYQKNNLKQAEKDVFLLKFDRVLNVYNQRSEQNDDTYRALRFLKLTNRRLDEVIKEDLEEEELRKAKEAAVEAKRKEEEEKKAQEEAKRKEAEAIKKKEEEAKRKEEEKKKQEAVLKAKEEEAKKSQKSFFDEINGDADAVIELDDEVEKDSGKALSDTVKNVSTLKDTIKEEEPVWKKLKDKVDAPPTQAEKLKKKKEKKEATLMERLARKDEKKTPAESKPPVVEKTEKATPEVKQETPVSKPKEKSGNDILANAKSKADEVDTVLGKVKEEKKDESVKSILDKAGKGDKKPSSLVDLLKAKEKENKKEEKKAPVATPPEAKVEEPKKEEKVEKQEPVKTENKEEKKAEQPAEESQAGSLLDRFRKQTLPLSDTSKTLHQSKKEDAGIKTTLADKLKAQKSSPKKDEKQAQSTSPGKPLKADEIPIHKQYRYVQKVFGGNNVRFRIIVDKINNADSSKEVEEILEKYVFNNSDMNREDETVKEFISLMRGQG